MNEKTERPLNTVKQRRTENRTALSCRSPYISPFLALPLPLPQHEQTLISIEKRGTEQYPSEYIREPMYTG